MPEIKEIHNLTENTSINSDDVFIVQHDNSSIWVTLKVTLNALVLWIGNTFSFASISNRLTHHTITGAINDLVDMVGAYVEITGTLEEGETELVLADNAIVANCTIDVYVDEAFTGVVPTAIETDAVNHTVTLTFEEQEDDMPVKVRVS